MGIMRTAATRGIIPSGMKVTELRSNLIRLITEISFALDEQFGEAGLQTMADIFRKLGEEDAQILTERLDLTGSLRDAIDAWVVIGHVLGAKMTVREISENKIATEHSLCPQYEAFKERGNLYCEHACWPYVEAVGAGIGPGIHMEVIRPADNDSACTKALVFTESE